MGGRDVKGKVTCDIKGKGGREAVFEWSLLSLGLWIEHFFLSKN